MHHRAVFLFSYIITLSWAKQHLKFPEDFKFGAATSAYQIEGGQNDRSANIWDEFIRRNPSKIIDGSNASNACDSYHLWKNDVEIASEIGLKYYRFSISWTRLLPNGFANNISEDGRKYYDNLINALISRGMEPLITIYHFDMPMVLQELGGWTNPLISDWFADYARVVFSLYGDRVKTWITINEPNIICDVGYAGIFAPAISDNYGLHLCTKHIVLAHAKAWRIYDEDFKSKYNGKVSIGILFFWMEPQTEDDIEVTELTREYSESRYGHPIYSKDGGWPPKLQAVLTEHYRKTNNLKWNLPAFTDEEIKLAKGTYDFYGLNQYVTRLVRKSRPDEKVGPWPYDAPREVGAKILYNTKWKHSVDSWFQINPEGLRKSISWIRQRYGDNMEILVTENGYPMGLRQHNDYERIEYIRSYLYQLLLSIKEDGANVTGYIIWSIMDNFEWLAGYSTNYGLYEVDFNSSMRSRRPRASAHYYSKVIASGDPYIDKKHDHVRNYLLE